MGWVTGAAVFFIIWWLVLFVVLPFGVQAQGDTSEGHDPGAPLRPRVLKKMGLTTAIAIVLWLIVYFIDKYELITLSGL